MRLAVKRDGLGNIMRRMAQQAGIEKDILRPRQDERHQCRVCGIISIRWRFQSSLAMEIHPPNSHLVTLICQL